MQFAPPHPHDMVVLVRSQPFARFASQSLAFAAQAPVYVQVEPTQLAPVAMTTSAIQLRIAPQLPQDVVLVSGVSQPGPALQSSKPGWQENAQVGAGDNEHIAPGATLGRAGQLFVQLPQVVASVRSRSQPFAALMSQLPQFVAHPP